MTRYKSLILGAAIFATAGAANATTLVQEASIGIPELLGADVGVSTVVHAGELQDTAGKERHLNWCTDRYRSYNPQTDTFRGYDGLDHRCNSPYN